MSSPDRMSPREAIEQLEPIETVIIHYRSAWGNNQTKRGVVVESDNAELVIESREENENGTLKTITVGTHGVVHSDGRRISFGVGELSDTEIETRGTA